MVHIPTFYINCCRILCSIASADNLEEEPNLQVIFKTFTGFYSEAPFPQEALATATPNEFWLSSLCAVRKYYSFICWQIFVIRTHYIYLSVCILKASPKKMISLCI